MAATSECSDGPVMSFMNKRLRNLKKKLNRITQTEEALSQGKVLNKEQKDLLLSKPSVLTLIDEYEKLRQPLSTALQEELDQQIPKPTPPVEKTQIDEPPSANHEEPVLEDLLKLLYFGCLFDVKPQSDFTNTMLTRTHERGCCLTYDYVTDDAIDLLGEKDLDLISMLGGLVVSRPVHSSLSHKNALQRCLHHAKLWLAGSDQPIEDGVDVTYAVLKERVNKIVASDYFTTVPEMKAPVEVAAVAGQYAPNHVPVQGSSVSSETNAENDFAHHEEKDEETEHPEGQEAGADQSSPTEELHKEAEISSSADGNSIQQEMKSEADASDDQNFREVESKDHQYTHRRGYQNQNYRGGNRGGGGGRRGYSNGGRGGGGRGNRGGGGGYQNGRSQYNDQPGNYYPRNSYTARGRGGGKGYSNNYGPAQGEEMGA